VAINFYKKIKRNISEDGLIVGSSSFLVNSMVSKIDFNKPLRILEIGSGKGPFTRELIRRMSIDSFLDVSEIKDEYNPWIERLIRDNPLKHVQLFNGCVTELLKRPDYYDVIVSSLPLKNFSRMNDQNAFLYRLIEGFRFALSEGGIYLQYQYFRSNKADIEAVFGKEMDHVDFVPLNILPAFVYSMTK
jgi:phospholipid N-methyltransferase